MFLEIWSLTQRGLVCLRWVRITVGTLMWNSLRWTQTWMQFRGCWTSHNAVSTNPPPLVLCSLYVKLACSFTFTLYFFQVEQPPLKAEMQIPVPRLKRAGWFWSHHVGKWAVAGDERFFQRLMLCKSKMDFEVCFSMSVHLCVCVCMCMLGEGGPKRRRRKRANWTKLFNLTKQTKSAPCGGRNKDQQKLKRNTPPHEEGSRK